jgi:hypothetical protein
MTSPRWKLSLCLPVLIASTVLAAAQSAPANPSSAQADETTTASLWQAPLETTRRGGTAARTSWDDAHIKGFIGLSENAWDFTDPNGVPGFGPLSATQAAN